MTIQTQPIIIDPASIVAVGELRASRRGRPKKGVVVTDGGKVRGFNLSDDAHGALVRVAEAFGVSESTLVEAFARSLSGYIQST